VTLSVLTLYVNPRFARGSLHHDGGIVFFLVALVILIPIVHVVRNLESRSAERPSPADNARSPALRHNALL
jgi:hypothetical protein